MVKKANGFRRFVALVLAFVIMLPSLVFADASEVIYLTDDSLEDVIYSDNLFYIGTSVAQIDENSTAHYLLKIGRGGAAEDSAGVTLNISDITAKYGKDYKVRLYDGSLLGPGVEKTGSLSVVEMMTGDYTEFEVGNPEDLEQAINDEAVSGSAIYEGAVMAMNDAIAANAEKNGKDVSEYEAERDELEATPIEQLLGETAVEGETEADTEETTEKSVALSSLLAARKAYTGLDSDRKAMTSSSDLLTQLYDLSRFQDIADLINESFVAATLDVTFEPGENVKYIEIVPIDNGKSDGNRMFTIKLSMPSDGYTDSIYSSSCVTIVDDEPEVLSKFSFDSEQYSAVDNKVSVTIKRTDGLNNVSSVKLMSRSGTALSGRDFQPVNAEVVFPFGMSERTVDVQTSSTYLTDGADFYLYLEDYNNSEAGEVTEVRVSVPSATESVAQLVAHGAIITGDEPVASNTTGATETTETATANAIGSKTDTVVDSNSRKYFSDWIFSKTDAYTYSDSGAAGRNELSTRFTQWWLRNTGNGKLGVKFATQDYKYFVDGMRMYTQCSNGIHQDGAYIAAQFDGEQYLSGGGDEQHNALYRTTSWGNTWEDVYSLLQKTEYFDFLNYRAKSIKSKSYCDLSILSIKPIKRQFTINLKEADELKFVDENGNDVVDRDATSAYFAAEGLKQAGDGVDKDDTESKLVRVYGEEIKVDSIASYKSNFVGINLVSKDPNVPPIRIASQSAASSDTYISFQLDKSFNKYFEDKNASSYFTYTKNKNGGLDCSFTIQPVFEKIPKTVQLARNKNLPANEINAQNLAATMKINGKSYTVPMDDTLVDIPGIYVGDVITVTGGSNDESYIPYSVGYRIWDENNRTYDYTTLYKESYTRCFANIDDNVRRAEKVKFYPILARNNNAIKVRVAQSDIDSGCFDTSYGIFNTAKNDVNTVTVNGVEYREFVVAKKNVVVGSYYQLTARAADGYGLLWQLTTDVVGDGGTTDNSSSSSSSTSTTSFLSAIKTFVSGLKTTTVKVNDTTNKEVKIKSYTGETFFYEVESQYSDTNVIYLTATKDNVYTYDFSGKAMYKNFNIKTGKTSTGGYMPTSGVIFYFGGSGATTDSDGNFETTPVKYVDGAAINYAYSFMGHMYYDTLTIDKNDDKITAGNKTYTKEVVKNVLNDGVWEKVTEQQEASDYVYSKDIGTLLLNPNDTSERCGIKSIYFEKAGATGYNKTEVIDIDGSGYRFAAIVENEKSYTVQGIDTATGENKTTTKTEKVKQVEFLIYDSDDKLKTTYKAKDRGSNLWSTDNLFFEKGNEAEYTKGDRIFVRIVTDLDWTGLGATTEYPPINTGRRFIITNENKSKYQPQLFDLPVGASYASLPMLDKLAMGFNFPYISVSLENGTKDGTYRIKVGVNVTQIYDAAKDTHISKKVADNGVDYSSMFQLAHPIDSFTDIAKQEWGDTITNAADLFNGTTAQLGPLAINFNVVVGMYFDFGDVSLLTTSAVAGDDVEVGESNYYSNVDESVLLGVGGYIGASVQLQKAVYTLIGGVVPGYLGFTANASLNLSMGGEVYNIEAINKGINRDEDSITLGNLQDETLDFSTNMKFDTDLSASATLAVYAGVGLCGTFGVRIGGEADFVFVWYPMAKEIWRLDGEAENISADDTGVETIGTSTSFKVGGWIDVVMFTIPVLYNIKTFNTNFAKQAADGKLVRRSSVSDNFDSNAETVTGQSTAFDVPNGWYYIKNLEQDQYLQLTGKTVAGQTEVQPVTDEAAVSVGNPKNNDPHSREWYVYTDANGNTSITYYYSESGKRQYVYADYTNNKKTNSVYKSAAVAKQDVTNDYKFKFRKIGEGVYTAAPVTTESNAVSKGLVATSKGGNVTVIPVALNELSKTQMWSFEPVSTVLSPGTYNISSAADNRVITAYRKLFSISTGKVSLSDTLTKNDKSQMWTVSYNEDGKATLRDNQRSYYIYSPLCSDGSTLSMCKSLGKIANSDQAEVNVEYDGYGHYTISLCSYPNLYFATSSDGNIKLREKYDLYEDAYNTQLWVFTSTTLNSYSVDAYEADTAKTDGTALRTHSSRDTAAAESTIPDFEDKLAEPKLRTRTSGDSVWEGESNQNRLEAYGGFKQSYEGVLVDNSYERPDSQIMDMGDGKYILVFIDTDESRGELERNALKYSFYDGSSWSAPVTIQEDGTADFSPSIADAGDNVAVAWTSSDPKAEKTGDAVQYLTTTEIYTTLISKSTGEVGEITRLTTDNYYDSDPNIIYDATTGNMACYYLKSSVSSSFQDSVTPTTNGCILTYMLFDGEMNRWLFDYYYPEEEERLTEEAEKELLENWNGQRFLSSAMEQYSDEFEVYEDPVICDFAAISYNGLAVYAYTVDKDNDSATDSDRELFVQVMDMVNHKDYKPIRITDDNLADTLPQFVRNNFSENPRTMLYWFENNDTISSIDVSDLIKNGINDDGTIMDDYELLDYAVQVKMGEGLEFKPSMSSYKVYEDIKDNTYIVWSDINRDTGKQEIYASALISNEGGLTNWSDAYQLTHSDKYNDEPAFVVDDNGTLILVNDRYDMTLNLEDTENPATISDNQLVVTHFEPCGELYAQDISFSNLYPTGGTAERISYTVKNKGLTTANGYTINVYEVNGARRSLIDTKEISESLVPGSVEEYISDWTTPDDVDGVKIEIDVVENGTTNVVTAESEQFKAMPYYSIDGFSAQQVNDGFVGYVRVTNVGNRDADGSDVLEILYSKELLSAERLGIEDTLFADEPISLAVGETQEFELPFNDNLSGSAFKALGYISTIAYAVSGDEDEVVSDYKTSTLSLTAPVDIKINGGVDSISLNADDTAELTVEYSPADRFSDAEIKLVSDDNEVAIVSGNKVIPVGNGTTTIKVYILPYGSYAEVEVVVTGFTDTAVTVDTGDNTAQNDTSRSSGRSSSKAAAVAEVSTEGSTANAAVDTIVDAFTDISNHWGRDIINEAAEKNIVSGYSDNTFRPNNSITRAELLTILYNSGLADTTKRADVSFTDISGNEWYNDYVKWGVANNLIVGYEDNTFRGNDAVSRQEMAVVISKFVDLVGIAYEDGQPIAFADGAAIAQWARSYVDKISSYGIVTGDNNNCYLPDKELTRAETAVIVNRLVK